MTRLPTFCCSVLAGAFVFLMPTTADAAWFCLKNDTRAPLLVQTGMVMPNNTVVPGRPLVIYPGEQAWDCVVKPAVKVIVVRDAVQRQVILLERRVTVGPGDAFYSFQYAAPKQLRMIPVPPVQVPARGKTPPRPKP